MYKIIFFHTYKALNDYVQIFGWFSYLKGIVISVPFRLSSIHLLNSFSFSPSKYSVQFPTFPLRKNFSANIFSFSSFPAFLLTFRIVSMLVL